MYTSYRIDFTEKQAKVLYKAVKRGELHAPGRYADGFMYRFVGASRRLGSTSEEDRAYNDRLWALGECVGLVIAGDFQKAQELLDYEFRPMSKR